jgi:hypothetical protein
MRRRVRLWLDSDSFDAAFEPMPFEVEPIDLETDTGLLDADGNPILRVRQIGFDLSRRG